MGVVTVIMTLLGWSAVPLFIKHFSHSIDVWTSNGWRYAISAAVWAPLVLWHIARRSMPAGIWTAALIPGIFNTLGQVTFGGAHYLIDPGLLTFGLRTQIVFVTVGAALLFAAERRVVRSPAYLAGIALVVVGSSTMILLTPGFGEKATTGGVALAVASGLVYACYALSVRWWMSGYNPIVAFGVISQYTAGALLVMMLVLGDLHAPDVGPAFRGAKVLDFTSGQMGLLVVSALIGIALGHVFYYISIQRLGVAVSSGVIQLQPILVSIASFFLFGERLSAAQWAGGAVALAGAATILVVQHRLRRGPTSPAAGPSPGEIRTGGR